MSTKQKRRCLEELLDYLQGQLCEATRKRESWTIIEEGYKKRVLCILRTLKAKRHK